MDKNKTQNSFPPNIYQTLFKSGATPLLLFNPKTGKFIEFNENACKSLGYARKEFQKLSVADFASGESPSKTGQHFKKILNNGKKEIFETEYRTKKGELQNVLVSAEMVKLGEEKLIALTWRDVTKLREIEKRLEKKRKIMDNLTANTATQLAYLDDQFRFVYVNRVFEKFCGLDKKKIIGKNYFASFPDKETQNLFEKAKTTGTKMEYKEEPLVCRKKISYWDLTLSPVKGVEGRVEGFVLSRTDKTENVKQARELARQAKSLKKFELATENSSDHMIITDPAGTIIYANPAAEKITGFSKKEMLGKKAGGKKLWGGQMQKDFYAKLWDTISVKKQPFRGEITNRRKNGEKYTADVFIAPLMDENGEIIYFVGVEKDITETKELDKMKTEFVSLASHQLRTPLASISLATEMMINSALDPAEQTKQLQEIAQDVQEMTQLIDALLNVSRLEMGTFVAKPERTRLVDFVENIVKNFLVQMKAKKLQLTKNYGKRLPRYIKTDPKVLYYILENILSNAIKFTAPEGRINVKVKNRGNNILLVISDTGLGIPKEMQPRVFTKLIRAHELIGREQVKSSGLGLYFAKTLADQCGGKIWFRSKKGRGTSFYVLIPKKMPEPRKIISPEKPTNNKAWGSNENKE